MSRPARDVLVVVVALTLGAIVLFFLGGCGGTSSTTSTSSLATNAAPQDRADAAARHFLKRYVTRDGRVSRRDQGGDTVGEGQAYGMLMAAAIGDARRFDAIWGWTKSNIRRPDGLISFLWRDGRVQDPQAASDADLDASRALLVAACRFNRPALRHEALQLGNAIMRIEVGSASFQAEPVLTAGPWAISPPPVTVNPSYFAPGSFLALRAASKDPRWGALAASSRSITDKLMPTSSRLPPDWARLEGDKLVPIGSPSAPQSPPQFGFDAVRTLIRMAEDPDATGRQIAARAWPVFENQDPTKLPVEHDLSGRATGHTLHPVALVAAAGAADAAGATSARDGLLDAAEALDQRSPTYYGAAWVALGRIMLTTKLLDTCS
ncbi:MAG: glycosyl hydrolase family 8 [Solirubrobacteraceae bacterium]